MDSNEGLKIPENNEREIEQELRDRSTVVNAEALRRKLNEGPTAMSPERREAIAEARRAVDAIPEPQPVEHSDKGEPRYSTPAPKRHWWDKWKAMIGIGVVGTAVTGATIANAFGNVDKKDVDDGPLPEKPTPRASEAAVSSDESKSGPDVEMGEGEIVGTTLEIGENAVREDLPSRTWGYDLPSEKGESEAEESEVEPVSEPVPSPESVSVTPEKPAPTAEKVDSVPIPAPEAEVTSSVKEKPKEIDFTAEPTEDEFDIVVKSGLSIYEIRKRMSQGITEFEEKPETATEKKAMLATGDDLPTVRRRTAIYDWHKESQEMFDKHFTPEKTGSETISNPEASAKRIAYLENDIKKIETKLKDKKLNPLQKDTLEKRLKENKSALEQEKANQG